MANEGVHKGSRGRGKVGGGGVEAWVGRGKRRRRGEEGERAG